MATIQCQTCGGIYEDLLPDHTRYFHACSPLSRPEFEAAVLNGTITLRKDETAEQAFDRRSWPRPNARDENIDRAKVQSARTSDGKPKPGTTAEDVIKAPGAGVAPVAGKADDDV